MINFAILAAGEGSRLKSEGIDVPKPLLEINGTPMITRLINIFKNQGAERVHIVINNQSLPLKDYLDNHDFGLPLDILIKDTPSSLHTFYELVKINPEWNNCCLTTTDTIFREEDFTGYIQKFRNEPNADAFMGITPFIDDESPLYISTNSNLEIESFTDIKTASSTYVSGGIYGLRKRALDLVSASIEQGNSRMRNYQRSLLENNLSVKGYVFDKIVDVDHIQDRETAEAFLKEQNHK